MNYCKTRDEVLSDICWVVDKYTGKRGPMWPHGNTKDKYLISIPCPGYSAEDFKVYKRLNSFSVETTNYGASDGISFSSRYDEEYLTIVCWTVSKGMFHMVFHYEVPSKFKEIVDVNPMSTDEFRTTYGV